VPDFGTRVLVRSDYSIHLYDVPELNAAPILVATMRYCGTDFEADMKEARADEETHRWWNMVSMQMYQLSGGIRDRARADRRTRPLVSSRSIRCSAALSKARQGLQMDQDGGLTERRSLGWRASLRDMNIRPERTGDDHHVGRLWRGIPPTDLVQLCATVVSCFSVPSSWCLLTL
jgi:hypothetical protein